jgi:hypothetical protein
MIFHHGAHADEALALRDQRLQCQDIIGLDGLLSVSDAREQRVLPG